MPQMARGTNLPQDNKNAPSIRQQAFDCMQNRQRGLTADLERMIFICRKHSWMFTRYEAFGIRSWKLSNFPFPHSLQWHMQTCLGVWPCYLKSHCCSSTENMPFFPESGCSKEKVIFHLTEHSLFFSFKSCSSDSKEKQRRATKSTPPFIKEAVNLSTKTVT